MRHRKKKITLDRTKGKRTLLLKGLAAEVVLRERVKTTEAKAKAVRSIVERAISRGKVNSFQTRRQLSRIFTHERPIKKIMDVLGPRYANRAGGYTRIVKLGQRAGDAAKIVLVELV